MIDLLKGKGSATATADLNSATLSRSQELKEDAAPTVRTFRRGGTGIISDRLSTPPENMVAESRFRPYDVVELVPQPGPGIAGDSSMSKYRPRVKAPLPPEDQPTATRFSGNKVLKDILKGMRN